MKDYEIQFSGLKTGKHLFEFEIGDAFFAFFDDLGRGAHQVDGGNLKASVELDKKENMLVFDFDIQGDINLACDRCSGLMESSVSTSRRIIGKFSDEETWHEDDIIHLPTRAYKIDLKDLIHEFIDLAIPSKNVHPEGECDPEMIKKLDEYRVVEKENEEETVDPRWEQLKKLK